MSTIGSYLKPFHGLEQHGTAAHPKSVTLIVVGWEPDGKGEPTYSQTQLQQMFFGATNSVASWLQEASRGRFVLAPHPTHPVIGPFVSKKWWPFYWRNATRESFDPTTGTWGSNYVKDRLTAEEWAANPYKVPPDPSDPHRYQDASGEVWYLDDEGYIGGHSHSWAEAIREAAKVIDFSALDSNGDGVLTVDDAAVVVVKSQASTSGTRRPVSGSDVPKTDLIVDGVAIHQVCELYAGPPGGSNDVAVAIEEVIHLLLNYADQYPDSDRPDTDPGRPGQLSLSDAGHRPVHVDAYHRMKWGWTHPTLVDVDRVYTLHDAGSAGEVLIVPSRIKDRQDEFFLVENRWRGTSYDAHRQPHYGDGLAIWHCIEDASLGNWGRTALHLRRADPSVAADTPVSEQRALFDGADPARSYPLDDDSAPSDLRFRDGRASGIMIDQISPAGATMTLRVRRTNRLPVVKYQAAWQHDAHVGVVVLLFDGGGGKQLNGLDASAFRALTRALRGESPVFYDPDQDVVLTLHEPLGESEN
jgi:M6 family metalloprotease-like protein